MKIEDLGYNDYLEKYRNENSLGNFEVGRIIAEHKERYTVITAEGKFEAEITGNMRYTAVNREDFPATGDWVAINIYDSSNAIIHHIFPRFSMLKRQAVGTSSDIQIIATNIDYAFIVQAMDRDYNINRLERYLTICNTSKVTPVILLSKIDLIDPGKLNEILQNINARIKEIPILTISSLTNSGYEVLRKFIKNSKTYCLLGSSGVGKSTLINNLVGKKIMQTNAISESTNKGRHVTSHRELVILENGGIIIDNPGMREVGITDASEGLEKTFNKILLLAEKCRFKDCTHTDEAGCNVIKSVEKGELDRASYKNYLKMEKEKAHFESSIEEKRKKDKAFGKMLKNYKKDMKRNDY